MIKKPIIVVLLLLSTLSIVPLVSAEEDEIQARDEIRERSLPDQPVKDSIRNQVINRENSPDKELEGRIANAREKVVMAKERVKEVREKYSVVKGKYADARNVYKDHRIKLIQLKDRAKDCDDNCQVRKTELKIGVLNHLIKTNELIERSIDKLISRLNEAPIDDDEKAQALEQLEALEIKVTEQREKVQALITSDATNDEVREAIADLKQTWKDVRITQRRIIASLTSAKLDNLVEKHQEYDNGMTLRISQLKEKNVDVARLEGLQRQFQSHLEKLSIDHEAAQSLWQQAKEGQDKLKEWHLAQQKVRNDLKESKLQLRKFLAVYKELRPLDGNE